MSDNHDLLNDKDVCSFEEHEAENVCSNKDAVACGDGVSAGEKRYIKHQQFISYLSKIIKRGILFEKEKRRNNNPFQRSRIFDLCCFCW